MPLWSELSRSRPTILNQKRKRAPNKRSASDCLDHPLTLPEQVRPALQEECTGHLLSLRTIGYDCVFPRGYIPRRRQTDKLLRGLGKGKTQQRQNQSNQSGDREVCCAGKGDMGPGARGFMTARDERSQDFGVGGVLFQKYTGSSLSLFYKKKLRRKRQLQLL